MDGVTIGTGYCLVPLIGVTATGYGFAPVLLLDPVVRRRWLLALGAAGTVAFIFLRAANGYGDPRPWTEQPRTAFTVLSFLNCTKYPASLLYLLMTLSPAMLALALFDRPLGVVARPYLAPSTGSERPPRFESLLALQHIGLDASHFPSCRPRLDTPAH